MNGRHRAVIVANIIAAYLKKFGVKVKINYLGAMYEGRQPRYPKPWDKRKRMRPDDRGTCGCFQGPRY
eukprot:6179621-Karenia_brevis.AAC.1